MYRLLHTVKCSELDDLLDGGHRIESKTEKWGALTAKFWIFRCQERKDKGYLAFHLMLCLDNEGGENR